MRTTPEMNLRISNISIAIVIAFLTSMMSGCNVGEARTGDAAQTTSPVPLPVAVVQPRYADIFATYFTTTPIASDADAPIPARVAGEVVEILVEEGDWVHAGQALARLDGERHLLQLKQAKANLEKTTRELERFTNLQKRGLVSAAAVDNMRYDLESLQANFELQQLFFDYTMIRAPIEGVVSSRDIKLGQHVNEADITFRITDTSQLLAYLNIPQNELAKFSAGIIANVRVDALPGQVFSAVIARISPTIDARNGTFRATALIDNDAELLVPGMFGRFEIAYEKHANALIVPSTAILEEDEQHVVYIVSDGAAVRKAVEIGIEQDGNVEILRGLDGHEQIIVTGQGGLRDGSIIETSISTVVATSG